MKPSGRAFQTQVSLPCTVFCSGAAQKISGTALRIERETMVLRISDGARGLPRIGETVDLEVHLPVNSELVPAKDLFIHGLIVEASDTGDGAHRFVLNFRRAHFKDRNRARTPKKRKAAAESWEM